MLSAALVGAGRWGQRLVDSVQLDGRPIGDKIRFVRAVASTPAKVEAYCRAQHLTLGDDYQAVLADPSIGAVVLATPHSQHAEQIIAAAACGKHVFVEKPFTLTRESAERAVGTARQASIVLALGHNRRFLPAMHALKELIGSGALGQLLHVEGNFSSPGGFTFKPGMWRAEAAESPAGGMTPTGIHTLDAFIHLLGPIRWVRAVSLRQFVTTNTDDTTALLLRFLAGPTGYLATVTVTARIWRIQVFGTKGWAHMRSQDTLDVSLVVNSDKPPHSYHFPPIDIERAELEAFADAVAGGSAYPLPWDEAIHGIAALEAIIASARRGGDEVAV
ncbi:MAG: Gfo/Idh/MocA family oxidoreductase [Alphaproteobacteria bacterium]|nr:Gfo/Idh/MocA family oxidoreductase [Alphaproteobacteria bacterium]